MAGPEATTSTATKSNSHWLNAPNSVTMARLILSIFLFWLIYVDYLWLTAAGVFVLAAATDWLDGYLARKYGQVTVLGRVLDPFVDKIIVCGAFVFLLEKPQAGVSSWIVVLVISREMFVSSLRGIIEKQGVDFSARTAGKAKMVLQCMAVTGCLLSLRPELQAMEGFLLARDIVLYIAVAATIWSGGIYIWQAYRVLSSRT